MDTKVQTNFKNLLNTLKECLQPKDENPENRPTCRDLLYKIFKFTLDKNILVEDKNIIEFLHLLDNQKMRFLISLLRLQSISDLVVKNSYEKALNRNLKLMKSVGQGQFGEVMIVKDIYNNMFALKKVEFRGIEILKINYNSFQFYRPLGI